MKETERAKLENNRRLNADGEKIANDAMIAVPISSSMT